jgi:succinate dehydrogenase assembly factor 2
MVKMKARLLYQSRKRGIKENDLIMGTFAHKFMDDFDLDQYVSLTSPL